MGYDVTELDVYIVKRKEWRTVPCGTIFEWRSAEYAGSQRAWNVWSSNEDICLKANTGNTDVKGEIVKKDVWINDDQKHPDWLISTVDA